jgi:hypothetical protein
LPLALVVRVGEASRVSPLAGRLQFDEADQRAMNDHRVIRPGCEARLHGLPHQLDGADGHPVHGREVTDQTFERRAELIFRVAGDGSVGELGLRLGSERGDRAA